MEEILLHTQYKQVSKPCQKCKKLVLGEVEVGVDLYCGSPCRSRDKSQREEAPHRDSIDRYCDVCTLELKASPIDRKWGWLCDLCYQRFKIRDTHHHTIFVRHYTRARTLIELKVKELRKIREKLEGQAVRDLARAEATAKDGLVQSGLEDQFTEHYFYDSESLEGQVISQVVRMQLLDASGDISARTHGGTEMWLVVSYKKAGKRDLKKLASILKNKAHIRYSHKWHDPVSWYKHSRRGFTEHVYKLRRRAKEMGLWDRIPEDYLQSYIDDWLAS